MTERPLFLPLLSLIVGLSVAHHFSLFLPEQLLWPLFAAALLTIFVKWRLLFTATLAILFFAWGNISLRPFLQPSQPANHIARFYAPEPQTVEGVIDSRPESTDSGMRLHLRTERVYRGNSYAPVTGRLLLFVKEGRRAFLTGDRVRIVARIQEPVNFGIPGEFDYRRHLAYQEVFATAFVPTPEDVVLIKSGVGHPFQRLFDRLAASLGQAIGERFPGEEGGVLRALLLGERGFVSRATEDAYTRAGVNHILSISGFHVSVILLVLFQLFFRFLSASPFLALHVNLRRVVLLTTLPAIVFYLFLSGAAPATVRSVIMVAVCIIALFVERETEGVNALMLAAFLILALSPQALFDISFQLSFLALWGILVLSPLFMKPFDRMGEGIAKKLVLFLMVSAAATVVTLAPVAHYFHRTTATGLISNFFAVPLLGYGAVVAGFSALPFVHAAPAVADPLLASAAWLVKISNALIISMSRIPSLPIQHSSNLDLFLLYTFMTLLTFIGRGRSKWVCCWAVAVIFAGSHLWHPGPGPESMEITFFSVGQGESTLIRFPGGKTMLVDGGGSLYDGGLDVGERLLAPALRSLGVDSIDYMVMTHPHPDHFKGFVFVAATFPVGEFWESGAPSSSKEYAKLKWVLSARGVPVRHFDASAKAVTIGGVRLDPLAPARRISPTGYDEADLNDDSLVFRLSLGSFSMLFTGDIGFVTEEELLSRCPDMLRCTVLKVPHHGSRHSSCPGFLQAVSPRVGLISAGVRNSFGLPSPDTLDRLREAGIPVYRTDLDKTITIVTDGRSWSLSKLRPPGIFVDKRPVLSDSLYH